MRCGRGSPEGAEFRLKRVTGVVGGVSKQEECRVLRRALFITSRKQKLPGYG